MQVACRDHVCCGGGSPKCLVWCGGDRPQMPGNLRGIGRCIAVENCFECIVWCREDWTQMPGIMMIPHEIDSSGVVETDLKRLAAGHITLTR
eukprot:1153064-Pelagomonas_calceolata.AAC.7